MRIGTRSILFGGHQFLLHPIFVARAWRQIYGGWPRKWPEWVAIICHDLGYWGKADMDGEEGVCHPSGGANLVSRLCDRSGSARWWRFAAGHSRSFADLAGIPTSALMPADKLATVLMPLPLYAGLCWCSGEWLEYRDRWVAAGTYPGRADDGIWVWARHLRANWRRFERADAVAGRAYGGE
jgi:hypothetical protein